MEFFAKLCSIMLACCCCFGFAACGGDGEEKDPPAAPVAQSISVSGMKTGFEYGEEFSAGGLIVTAKYSDGVTKTVEATDYTVDSSAYRKDAAGTYTIWVISGKLKAHYSVTVGKRTYNGNWNEDGVLRILLIGNSFSEDTFEYLWEICNSLDINAEIGLCWIGGKQLDDHYAYLTNLRNVYEYRLKTTENGGVLHSRMGVTMDTAVTDRDWDVISLQQGYSWDSSTYSKLGPIATYLREHYLQDKPTQINFLMTWALPDAGPGCMLFDYYDSQAEMYAAIVSAMKNNVMPLDLPIIPSGTAIQNARSSYLGDTLNRDVQHLSYGLGRYISGLTYFKKVTGLTIPANVFAPTGNYAVSARDKAVAIEAANNAIEHPLEVTRSQDTAK